MVKTILPISDIHGTFRVAGILAKGVRDATWVAVDCDRIDFITISGDISVGNRDWNLVVLRDFLVSFPNAKVVFISGNHDTIKFHNRILDLGLQNELIYLENQIKCVDGVTFYGCPFSLPFMDWNFMRSEDQIDFVLSNTMTDNIDVALFHTPPYGYSDYTRAVGEYPEGPAGSKSVLNAINKYKPRFAFWGHIHEWGGQEFHLNEITVGRNVSVLDSSYDICTDHLKTFSVETTN
jgi:Icc-related predicted phosphoesterase